MEAEDNGIDETGQEDQSMDSDSPADDVPEAANISQASEVLELVNSFLEELLPEENTALSNAEPADNATALEEPVVGEDASQPCGEPGTTGPDLDQPYPEGSAPQFDGGTGFANTPLDETFPDDSTPQSAEVIEYTGIPAEEPLPGESNVQASSTNDFASAFPVEPFPGEEIPQSSGVNDDISTFMVEPSPGEEIPQETEVIDYVGSSPEEPLPVEDAFQSAGEPVIAENPWINQLPGESIPQWDDSVNMITTSSEAQSPEVILSPGEETVEPVISVQETFAVVNHRKIALILSGGGARGAFQVGAEMYARQVKGYHWDIIAGVSVGAMNGAMLAMHRYQRLMEIWNTISNSQVYTGGFNLPSLINLLFGALSFYSNAPLQKMMKRELEAGKIIDDLHVGVVSLVTGEYIQFTKEFLELPEAILASASIPVVWPPVDISPEHMAMVDGGVRNITPIGDVLDLEPDEIVIINCSPEHPRVLEKAPDNVLSIGMRALDIMQNEIFVNDVKEFLHINALVQEAEKQGILLHHPRTGRLLKYYPCVVIEPDVELGDTLDFSTRSVQSALKAGVRRAREALGKP